MFHRYVALFHMDIEKVDQNVAYVTMVVHVCCKLLFLMFHLFFQTYVASVFIWMLHISHVCCKYFIWMLRMLHNGFSCVFGCFCKCFRCMFQMFHLLQTYVVSVASGYFKSRSGVAHIAIALVAGGQRPAVELRLLPCAARLALPFLPFPPSRLGVGIGVGVIEFAAFERRR
jgi:hypothetical protein